MSWVLLAVIFGSFSAARAQVEPDGDAAGPAQEQARPEDSPLEGVWSDLSDNVEAIWRYPLFQLEDQPIRVSQLAVTLIILVVGLWLIRRISRLVGHRLMRVGRVDRNAAVLIQKLIGYTLSVLLALLAMDMVGLPITTFAFLGGALAIGLGFGAQNILNNFISGLILMVERPIRLNDLLEVGDHLGTAESIGARCTRIRRVDGIDLLVPNSKLLEETVINWTLSDKVIRTTVKVGVAYGTPTDRVAALIRQAVDQHPEILDDPPPIIIFEDFGDNALVFEVYFWGVMTRVMAIRQLRSEVRFAIDKLFREAGVTIAFPQRDVHLDAAAPVPVRIVGDADREVDT